MIEDSREDKIEYTKHLIDRAESGEHTKFELLTNIPSLLAAQKLKHATESVALAFKDSAKKCMKDYLAKLKNGIDDLQVLLNYRIFRNCSEFYSEESQISSMMITEFHNYMLTWGNFINTLVGIERPEDQMYKFIDIGVMERNE